MSYQCERTTYFGKCTRIYKLALLVCGSTTHRNEMAKVGSSLIDHMGTYDHNIRSLSFPHVVSGNPLGRVPRISA